MASSEEKQVNRKKAMKDLEKLLKMTYSGLTCGEYDILKAAYEYIDMKYYLEDLFKKGPNSES